MCGIAGLISYGDIPIVAEALDAMSAHMIARGPDGDGRWIDAAGRIGFAHRRLSIIDVAARSDQPMQTADGRLVVTYNGEIYNYRALREELRDRGYVFQTTSDTEVLLHLYDAYGPEMVGRLRGMFAFALHDTRSGRVLLARDPYGIKPLFYADDGRRVTFASQVKTVIASGLLPTDVDPAGVVGFYVFGAVPEPLTWRRAVRALPAGCTMVIDRGREPVISRFFSVGTCFAKAEQDRPIAPAEAVARLHHNLSESVAHHLVSDVPVGVFLSAGIDSGALLGLMRDHTAADIQTVTLCFEEFTGRHEDEAPLAEELARHYGALHARRTVTRAEFEADLPKILAAMDQPSIDGVNTWFISKAAREQGLKVAVSGLGGDELFGGYPSFRDVPRAVRMLRALGRRPTGETAIAPLISRLQRLTGGLIDPKIAALLQHASDFPGAYLVRRGVFMPSEIGNVLDADFARAGLEALQPLAQLGDALQGGPQSDFGRVATLEASVYMRNQLLRDADWASMAHGLEVRVPMVDSVLLEQSAPILASALYHSTGKSILAQAPRRPLPDHIANRPKTGFSTPIAHWLQEDQRTQAWRSVTQLARPGCRWARRWAFAVSEQARAA